MKTGWIEDQGNRYFLEADGRMATGWKQQEGSSGDYLKAKEIRDTLVPYMDLAAKYSGMGGEYKVISLLKYITDEVGSCGGWPRIPCLPLTDEEKKEVREVLKRIGK